MNSALAIADDTHDTFLLEEVIDDATDGNFIKYIGNGSVQPFDFLEGDNIDRGKFLSFCQHVQYIKTKRFAFVGDFQGRKVLKSVYQIVNNQFFLRQTPFIDRSSADNIIVSPLRVVEKFPIPHV